MKDAMPNLAETCPLPDDLRLMVYPSLRCNLRCPFCYQQSFAQELPLEFMRGELWGLLAHARDLQVVGGEPTIIPWLLDYLKRAGETYPKLKVHILTNGVKFDAPWIAWAIQSSANVHVSLNAPSAEAYAAMTREPQAEKLWRRAYGNVVSLAAAIAAARADDVHLGLSMVVTQDSLPHLEAFAALAHSLDASCRLTFDCRPDAAPISQETRRRLAVIQSWWRGVAALRILGAGVLPAAEEVPPKTRAEISSRLDSFLKERSGQLAENPAPPPPAPGRRKLHSTEGEERNFGAEVAPREGRLICRAPWRSLVVTAWGDVLACPNLCGHPLGNIANASLEEIWNSPPAIELRRSVLAGDFKFCPNSCSTRNECTDK